MFHSSSRKYYKSTKPNFKFSSGLAWVAHPEKEYKDGEDAAFFSSNAIGVFDGVSAWAERGYDAGLYSSKLCTLTRKYIDRNGLQINDALEYAVRENDEIGTSTACVAGIVDGRHLHGVNVGDSGFIIIRDREIVYRSTEQQADFNFPYQLGTDSRFSVEDGANTCFALELGDWIVMGTDGLWDNVFKTDAKDYVVRHDRSDPEDVARGLRRLSQRNAHDNKTQSPFSKKANKAGRKHHGGKIDDITIVCAKVVEEKNSDEPRSRRDPRFGISRRLNH